MEVRATEKEEAQGLSIPFLVGRERNRIREYHITAKKGSKKLAKKISWQFHACHLLL